MQAALGEDLLVAVSGATVVEAGPDQDEAAHFRWYVSRLEVLPVTESLTWSSIDLLRNANLHGHKYPIDAIVAATAPLSHSGPRIIFTSDVDDMTKLCGSRVHVEGV